MGLTSPSRGAGEHCLEAREASGAAWDIGGDDGEDRHRASWQCGYAGVVQLQSAEEG